MNADMSNNLHILKSINEAKNQQHPFHVLGLSRLPIFMAALVGSLAISVIIKLNNVTDMSTFLRIGAILFSPFFDLEHVVGLKAPEHLVDVRIMQLLFFILLTLWA
jgi:hypothetical protein